MNKKTEKDQGAELLLMMTSQGRVNGVNAGVEELLKMINLVHAIYRLLRAAFHALPSREKDLQSILVER